MYAFFSGNVFGWGALVCAAGLFSGCATAVREAPPGPAGTAETFSSLWGRAGEQWVPGGRLPDFSHAGYHGGERAIPDYPATTNVAAFGARGDDEADDTAAFRAALAATPSGAILVPPGRYILTDVLRITRPGMVLRGAGTELTTLYFPRTLESVAPSPGATTEGKPVSNFSRAGGFVRLEGRLVSASLAHIVEPANRGDRMLVVDKPGALAAGQTVQVWMTDTPDNTLARHLYSEDAGDVSALKGSTRASLVTRIIRIEGKRVELERPLRFDVKADWRPVLRTFRPTVQDAGVEDLTFEFPATPYGGPLTEQGQKPLAFVDVANCWARRLRFVNADGGPMVGGVFNTVADVVWTSAREPDEDGHHGHHGIYLGGLGDHLLKDFDVRTRFVHDITVSQAAGVVVAGGRGEDLCLDLHKRAPYEVLFTDLDMGAGTRPWRSGGGAALGKNGGARTTFWNLRSAGPLPPPPVDYVPGSANFVGVDFGRPDAVAAGGLWHEPMPGADLKPANLHEAQQERRLGQL